MIATGASSSFPFHVTGCTSTFGCHRATGSMTSIIRDCWNCHSYGPNRYQSQKMNTIQSEAIEKEKKKSKATKVRESLKNLPHNRKSMRY